MLAPGTLLADTYEIGALIGEGAMGAVYEARDVLLDRLVAVKVATTYADQLHNEARALAAVQHPGLVTVHAFGMEAGRSYMVMERVFGRSLESRIADREPISIVEVLDLGIGIADALSAAHRAGVSHRDLKPDNVLMCGERVVLVDFGLVVPEQEVDGPLAAAGSAEYMAPEVILGAVERGNGPLVDLYALGIILYEMLVGQPPFMSDDVDLIFDMHLTNEIPDIREQRLEVPATLAALVHDLVAKKPGDRPPSSEAVLWQLRDLRRRAEARGLDILVVDDDPAVLTVIARSLRSAFPAMRVTTSDRPTEVVEAIVRSPPHVLLVDLKMPDMNGIEVVMALNALPKEQRPQIVAMSAEAEDADLEVLRSLGVHHFVAKDMAFTRAISAIVGDVRDPH